MKEVIFDSKFPIDQETLKSLKDGGFILAGTKTLVAGIAYVYSPKIKMASTTEERQGSTVFATYKTLAGTPGSTLLCTCIDGTITITSKKVTGTAPAGGGAITITGLATASSDTSVINYLVVL